MGTFRCVHRARRYLHPVAVACTSHAVAAHIVQNRSENGPKMDYTGRNSIRGARNGIRGARNGGGACGSAAACVRAPLFSYVRTLP